jgi:hypothetical protein
MSNMNMSTNTNHHGAPHHKRPFVIRSAQEIVDNPPADWSVQVLELSDAPTEHRLRMRMMVFEHPDKGYRLLPFLTRRAPKRMRTEHGEVEAMDDFDMLPSNPLEVALPAVAVAPHEVLENLTTVLAEYSKKQAAMPPPSKRPVTQRPFTRGAMGKVAAMLKAQQEHQEQVAPQQERPRKDKKHKRHVREEQVSVQALPMPEPEPVSVQAQQQEQERDEDIERSLDIALLFL